MSFHFVGDRMDKYSETFSAILLCDDEEKNSLKTMLKGYSKPFRVLVVHLSSEAGAERVPGKIDKLVFKQAVVQRYYSQGLAAPRPTSMARSAVKPFANTFWLRLTGSLSSRLHTVSTTLGCCLMRFELWIAGARKWGDRMLGLTLTILFD